MRRARSRPARELARRAYLGLLWSFLLSEKRCGKTDGIAVVRRADGGTRRRKAFRGASSTLRGREGRRSRFCAGGRNVPFF